MPDSLIALKRREQALIERIVELTNPESRAGTRRILLDPDYIVSESHDPHTKTLVAELIVVRNALGTAR